LARAEIRGARLPAGLERLLRDEELRRQAAALGARVRDEPNGAAVAARLIAGRTA
jgi:hypothetical protein